MEKVAYVFNRNSRGGACVGHIDSCLLVYIVKGLGGHGSSEKVWNRPTPPEAAAAYIRSC